MILSETSKYRYTAATYIPEETIVLDIGSGGDPIVPWAISVDIPLPGEGEQYHIRAGTEPIHICCDARRIGEIFFPETCDVVYSSHLLEDFADWENVFALWLRLVKPGGIIIIIVPAKGIYKGYNLAHKNEFTLEQMESIGPGFDLDTLLLRTPVEDDPADYSYIGIWRKKQCE